ncbi:MAG: nitrate/nitrite transporter NrtS [Alphaproteobacteria bacterium]
MDARKPSVVALALSDGVPRQSLIAAVVVGTVLNLINQGDIMVAGGDLDYIKIVLTYAVPYFVASYGAVTARLYHIRRQGDGAPDA